MPLGHGAMSTTPHSFRWLGEPSATLGSLATGLPDVICFSHLRWDFPNQRPHHIMSRCARDRRVFYIEEPVYTTGSSVWLDLSQRECGIWVAVPYLPEGMAHAERTEAQRALVRELLNEFGINRYILWYYHATGFDIARGLDPVASIYDCVGSPVTRESDDRAVMLEREIMMKADLVFAAGESIFKTKRGDRENLYLCANGVDFEHFAQAREPLDEPADQAAIPYPRLGYCGVIDDRIDFRLLDAVAEARPDWQIVMVGPVVGLDPETLPQRPNIHYLGEKGYEELPLYIAGWETAMLPFIRNAGTREANPVKIAEYLAAGKPTVSTSISDIIHYYGRKRMVHIADTLAEFIMAASEAGMDEMRDLGEWLERVDHYFVGHTWDRTWSRMRGLMDGLTK